MKLAYLTTEYPAVSHTFIRREILELERRGHIVKRFSIRKPEKCIDIQDKSECEKTSYILDGSKLKLFSSAVKTLIKSPIRSLAALWQMFLFSRRSDRGIIRHLAYFIEACVLLSELHAAGLKHLHVHFGTNAATVAYVVKILSGKKISYSFTIHGPDEFDAPIGFSLKQKIIESEFVVAISNFAASQIKRWVPIEHWHKISIIRCTVDEFFTGNDAVAESKEQFNQLVCVGRLSAQKGHFVLLDAFKKVIESGHDCKLVLAGDGELRTQLESYINQHNLSNHVVITGWIDGEQVRRLILSSLALVLPSFAEGLPVVIMESFILKRPVITTRIAGIPELVVEGENGWLITPNDEAGLVAAIRELLNTTHEKLNKMGMAGYAAVKQSHMVTTEITKIEQAFASIVN
ncbi:glycosyltransferase family 4 protein [Methylophaga sp. OBS4]|uniref:glycosyltransferase family 4 protein n=1 Tax=Methylophaga sp. OBS4 TaxID=2991935 RepID=UPI00225897EA|nr:glycosyltransferase family 4 protein [Methylophaga sp. OBS4]MCX4188422.1 glycosyltransferase family 4 protein [Methylophaga sp. OBS4]